jgi:hypothetical protein
VTVGLDLGSTQFRSLRRQGDRLIGRSCAAAYVPLADSPAHRRLLDRDGVRYAEADGQLLILGDAVEEWSRLLHEPQHGLLPDGRLPADGPLSRDLLAQMLNAVLPLAQTPGELCCLTVPGELMPDDAGPEREFFLPLVRRRGYRPLTIGQGFAVVLAELAESRYSGVGISLGASQCEFALAHSGREIARCTIPWGSAELPAEVRAAGATIGSAALTDFLVELLLEAGERIDQHDGFRVLSQPVSLACSGGITALRGFELILQQAWRRAAWPIRLRSIHLATDRVYTIARGCLIQATLDARSDAIRVAA